MLSTETLKHIPNLPTSVHLCIVSFLWTTKVASYLFSCCHSPSLVYPSNLQLMVVLKHKSFSQNTLGLPERSGSVLYMQNDPVVKNPLFMQGTPVWSLVRELRFHTLKGHQAHNKEPAQPTPLTHTQSKRFAAALYHLAPAELPGLISQSRPTGLLFLLQIPQTHYCLGALALAVPYAWNALPQDIHMVASSLNFCLYSQTISSKNHYLL